MEFINLYNWCVEHSQEILTVVSILLGGNVIVQKSSIGGDNRDKTDLFAIGMNILRRLVSFIKS